MAEEAREAILNDRYGDFKKNSYQTICKTLNTFPSVEHLHELFPFTIECVLFDLDGTIVDSEHLHALALEVLLKEIQFEPSLTTKTIIDRYQGTCDEDIFDVLKLKNDYASLLERKKSILHNLLVDKSPLIAPKMRQFCKDVSSNFTTAITASEKETAEFIFKQEKLNEFF